MPGTSRIFFADQGFHLIVMMFENFHQHSFLTVDEFTKQ
jgi:hypothetical protein